MQRAELRMNLQCFVSGTGSRMLSGRMIGRGSNVLNSGVTRVRGRLALGEQDNWPRGPGCVEIRG